ncbi:hypothetical protein K438DRAFT_2025945 [Mycena galopus ATCC 62051]|nr:hypothetical protein K438DRAFT_2025945 [Mycena galopus ATCC 62051]
MCEQRFPLLPDWQLGVEQPGRDAVCAIKPAPEAFAVLIHERLAWFGQDGADIRVDFPFQGSHEWYEYLSAPATPALIVRSVSSPSAPIRPTYATYAARPALSLKPRNPRGRPLVRAAYAYSLMLLSSAAPNKPLVSTANGSARDYDKLAVTADDDCTALREHRPALAAHQLRATLAERKLRSAAFAPRPLQPALGVHIRGCRHEFEWEATPGVIRVSEPQAGVRRRSRQTLVGGRLKPSHARALSHLLALSSAVLFYSVASVPFSCLVSPKPPRKQQLLELENELRTKHAEALKFIDVTP